MLKRPVPALRVNQRIGAWTVLKPLVDIRHGHKYSRCLCECGVTKDVRWYTLLSGDSTGCSNCHHKRHLRSTCDHPAYKLWTNMRSRCNGLGLDSLRYQAKAIRID